MRQTPYDTLRKMYMEFLKKTGLNQITYDWTICFTIVLVWVGYVFLHDLFGATLLSHNAWDSYTLQTLRWLDGEVGLGQNYDYLELAVYKEDWFVSFPPFPSVMMIPWVLIYGGNTPNNLIMIVYVTITIVMAYKCLRFYNMKENGAAFLAVVTVLGSNMLWMSLMGGVWFQAQLICMMLCISVVWCLLNEKRVAAYGLLAFAVGCRPFAICYFPLLFIWFFNYDRKKYTQKNSLSICLLQVKALIIPVITAGAYMLYNYKRFHNIFEFGHNYLPEFTKSEYGQFHWHYLKTNLHNLFVKGFQIKEGFNIEIYEYNGFWFYIANPLFLICIGYLLKDLLKKEVTLIKLAIVLGMVCNIILLCFHKTLGGWQFGARYTVDMIPFAFLYILISRKKQYVTKLEWFIGIFALMFNLYGAMYVGNQ